MGECEAKHPEAIALLEEGLEESLQFFSFNEIDAHKISSTNLLERLNREIRRRTKVVGIFPSMDSYIRLVTSYLIEYSEDWSTGRSYINPKIITEIQLQLAMTALLFRSDDGFCELFLTLS
jgi:putative transposase